MLIAKECSSVVNIGVVDQDLVYLLVDGLSGCGCISRREACHETDVVIDECLSGKSELAAVSLQLSLRELVIFEDVMLELSVLRYLVELADWSSYVVVVMLLEVLQGSLLCELIISTHALTEGDGKFRQIFLLNRGYACSISLYFLPHFISLLPQILSFQQKSFKFQVRIFLLFSVHLAFALQNQCVHHVKYRFCTNMFYFVFVLFTQIVKPQTIGLFIYDFF